MKKFEPLKIEVQAFDVDIITTSGNTGNTFESYNGYDDVIGDFGS